MVTFLKMQWERKFGWSILIWVTGTILAVTIFKATFDQWANFTEWLTGLLFTAHVSDKVLTKPNQTR